MLDLTERQAAVLRLYDPVDTAVLAENEIDDRTRPLIRSGRAVRRSLERLGLVRFGDWWDDERGYDIEITVDGWAARDALISRDAADSTTRPEQDR